MSREEDDFDDEQTRCHGLAEDQVDIDSLLDVLIMVIEATTLCCFSFRTASSFKTGQVGDLGTEDEEGGDSLERPKGNEETFLKRVKRRRWHWCELVVGLFNTSACPWGE